MVHRRFQRQIAKPTELLPLVQLWIFRILVELDAQREFLGENSFSSEKLALSLGMDKWIGSEEKPYDLQATKIVLRDLHQKAEKKFANAALPKPAKNNVQRLSNLANLSITDRDILTFAIMIHSERLLDDVADMMGTLNTSKTIYALSIILNLPLQAVRESLGANSALKLSGLVSIDRRCQSYLRSKLDIISDSLAENIDCEDIEPISFIKDIVFKSAPSTLKLDNFSHVEKQLCVMRHYLKHALNSKIKGVNIFIHGSPGTGKSQLAKVISQDIGCELFEISSEDSDGDPIQGVNRLRAFSAAQRFFGQKKTLILFDEVEDVFQDFSNPFGFKSPTQSNKAWINRSLEENLVPSIWISNNNKIDPALIRRFDIVFELAVPPRKNREEIIRDSCSNLVDEITLQNIARSEELSPAVLTRTAAVIQSIQKKLGNDESANAFKMLINSTLEAQGHKKIDSNSNSHLSEIYDPAFICADVDLSEVANGIAKSKTGRLCLYGPPGTGKTAFGRWLSEQLDAPLLVKRASDLMSKWLGGTEKNIALAFDEARESNSILLIDEVDSFLQDRRDAKQSWEVTSVNEMLTQMETYSGIFIASTNLMSGLDQAALRRFDLKVKFDYLSQNQVEIMFNRYCVSLGLALPSSDAMYCISRLSKLTPGDFATVVRQNKFRPIESSEALYLALKAECEIKDGSNSRKIGF